MTKDDYISRLLAGWPRDGDATLGVIALADEALRLFPQSARFWVMRGDLIQLGSESCPYPTEESLTSYQRAVQIAPEFAEAWDEIGHYYHAVLNDETTAQRFFREAERLRGHKVA